VLILKGLTLRQNCAHLLRMIEDHRRGQGLATTIPGRYRTEEYGIVKRNYLGWAGNADHGMNAQANDYSLPFA